MVGQGHLLGRPARPDLLLAALLDTGGAAPGSGTQPHSDTGGGDICYIVDTIAHFSTYCSTYHFLRLHPIQPAGRAGRWAASAAGGETSVSSCGPRVSGRTQFQRSGQLSGQ